MARRPDLTSVERRLDDAAHRLLGRAPGSRLWGGVVEFLVFGAKQAWACVFGGVLRIMSVALFTGFMYGAVGSYMVRVYRLFDLRFTRYPPLWLTVIVAAAIYANFFTQHFIVDLRWVLLVAVLAIFGACTMQFHVFRKTLRMPLVIAFGLVASFIWLAENIATYSHAWTYPDQVAAWHPVSPVKLVSWFLLMIISVVLVTWVYPPRRPDAASVAAPQADFD